MRLKSLEILGFKSFANKTIFSFPANVTAIVGPNGSGKSNVVDAIRWVLGERDLKSLRVGRSDEIIFGGTPNRSRMSLAQVSITLDNAEGELPVDFKEIVVTRKINRDSEAEYLINQSNVRLKDVVELLAKAKVGSQGLTIMNQGSADAILKASPRERRSMIEESLGLREFQLKKEEAKRRLISTEENLEKTRALLEELRPHLRSLRRQVGRWERREEMVNNLQLLERLFFSAKFQEVYRIKNEADEKLHKFRESAGQEEKILTELEKEFERLEKQRPDFSQEFKNLRFQIEKLEQERNGISRELGQIEGKIEGMKRLSVPKAVSQPNFQELEKTLQTARELLEKVIVLDDLEEIRREIRELIEKINLVFKIERKNDDLGSEQNQLEAQRDSFFQKTKLLDERIKSFNQKLDELRQKDEQMGADTHDILIKIQKQRMSVSSLNQEMNDLLLSSERAKLRESDLLMKLKESNLAADEFIWEKIKNFEVAEELSKADFDGSLDDLEMKTLRLRHDLAAIGEVDEILVKEARETEERYDFLSRELEDLEKAEVNLTNIIEELTEKIDTEFVSRLKIINEEFNKYFRLMFGGGKAKLLLVQPIRKTKEEAEGEDKALVPAGVEGEVAATSEVKVDNPEVKKEVEPGIDFSIDLPKKKIKSLDLLSGGERSLVSISALFAIVGVMQPPFIVLDEVDAALDESNARKFAKILSELKSQTQFVIITHNRSTMEVSQILYGISMAEEGISKAISLKLEEAE
ncbi:MAG TPA: AAA family ATPase [Candidatus Paceibacterota bacterium]|nr:AAA family ATPase [Candidatus Paceibacterota bacterium]HRY77092.1 AAA family ATPase [Candidatus Paceibacterota bacterium]